MPGKDSTRQPCPVWRVCPGLLDRNKQETPCPALRSPRGGSPGLVNKSQNSRDAPFMPWARGAPAREPVGRAEFRRYGSLEVVVRSPFVERVRVAPREQVRSPPPGAERVCCAPRST